MGYNTELHIPAAERYAAMKMSELINLRDWWRATLQRSPKPQSAGLTALGQIEVEIASRIGRR